MPQEDKADTLPRRQDTGEKILLKRNHVNWYAPALYKMSGGSFEEMLDAVRTLPKEQRSFEDDWQTGKRWVLKGNALDTLQAQGFTIEKEPDITLRYRIEDIKSDVYEGANGRCYQYRLPATLKVRNKQGVMQEIHTFSVIVHDGPDAWDWTRKVEEAHAACHFLADDITGAWEKARQHERSLEAWVRAADAIKHLVEIDTFIWRGHDAPAQDATVDPVILALDEPVQERA